jgi:hypothetical protein
MLTARRLVSLVVVIMTGLVQITAFAHHGRGNRYDMDAEIPIEGTVRELVWRNPHIAIVIDVEDENGDVEPWVIEHSNVSTLARMGYHRNSLRPGQPVTAYINPGRDGEPIGLCQRIVLEDGSVIFVRGETVD